MPDYVYMLWSHGEDGPERLVATLDRSKLMMMANELNEDGWFERANENVIGKLSELLKQSDEQLSTGEGIHPLMSAWGGLHLQAVRLK